jgi:hypothetical protein
VKHVASHLNQPHGPRGTASALDSPDRRQPRGPLRSVLPRDFTPPPPPQQPLAVSKRGGFILRPSPSTITRRHLTTGSPLLRLWVRFTRLSGVRATLISPFRATTKLCATDRDRHEEPSLPPPPAPINRNTELVMGDPGTARYCGRCCDSTATNY